MTIMWHVDDLKASHNDYHEVTKFLMYLGDLYGNRITVNRGKYMITWEWIWTSATKASYMCP